MKVVELYGRVRYAVQIEGLSQREAERRFGIDPRKVAKMLAFSVPPGYRRRRPPARPKLGPFTGIIDSILAEDEGRCSRWRIHFKRWQGLADRPKLHRHGRQCDAPMGSEIKVHDARYRVTEAQGRGKFVRDAQDVLQLTEPNLRPGCSTTIDRRGATLGCEIGGMTLGTLGEDIGAMIMLIDRALELNPNYAGLAP